MINFSPHFVYSAVYIYDDDGNGTFWRWFAIRSTAKVFQYFESVLNFSDISLNDIHAL